MSATNGKKIVGYLLYMPPVPPPVPPPSSSPLSPSFSSLSREDSECNSNHRRRIGLWPLPSCCSCLCPYLCGLVVVLLLLMAVVIPLLVNLLTSVTTQSSTMMTNTEITTTVTTATTRTTTTVTSATTGTTATVTTTTVTTATTSTTSSTTSRTTTSATSSTTTSATSTTQTTTTTSTATTTTSRTSTTSTTSTTTTTTKTTTTTTVYNSCSNLRWNQTGEIVAGTGTGGTGLNQFQDPTCIEIDANDTMYICDHHNYRIQMWTKGASTGVTVIDTNTVDHPEALAFDNNGYLYLTGHDSQRVIRYPPNFSSFTVVAGVLNTGTTALNHLDNPLGMDVDDNFNLYIAERDNKRVVKWTPNSTNGIIVIGTGSTPEFYGLLLSLYSNDQVYVSSEDNNAVYLWTFGASSPSVTLTQVNATPPVLSSPRGIEYDTYGNLYVCDTKNQRVIMYCANSTIGKVVVQDNIKTDLQQPDDVAFDSNLNMYVLDNDGQKVVKYARL